MSKYYKLHKHKGTGEAFQLDSCSLFLMLLSHFGLPSSITCAIVTF